MYYGVSVELEVKIYLKTIILMHFQYARNVSGLHQSPTSSQFIASLTDIQVKTSSQIEEKECPVCLKIPEIGDILHKLPCSHIFHKSCIVEWLRKVRISLDMNLQRAWNVRSL